MTTCPRCGKEQWSRATLSRYRVTRPHCTCTAVVNDMEALARIISQVSTDDAKQRERAKMELAWQGKQQATQPQAEPVGLFEQKQEVLF